MLCAQHHQRPFRPRQEALAGSLEPQDQHLTPSWANFFTRGFLAVSITQRREAISALVGGLGDEQEDTKKTLKSLVEDCG